MFHTKYCINDWVLIKYIFEGKSAKVLHYIGIVKDVNDSMFKIKFVKLKTEDKRLLLLYILLHMT